MATLLDYAALSAIVYNDVRKSENVISPLPSWTSILSDSNLGFTAAAYQNGNEIVIAFKGTDTLVKNATVDWLAGNVPTGLLGIGSPQLLDAALFYQAVKAANPGANITFTGHSLGGGLASLMSVYFDKSATTFAEAPFLLTAVNPVVTGLLGTSLALNGISDSDFAGFAANPLATGMRSSNVHDYYINGEILNYLRSPLTAIYGQDSVITVGGASLLPGSAVGNAITLHSMNLTASLLMSQTFLSDTISLPNLLSEILDTKLYAAAPEGQVQDFLIHLLSDQISKGHTNADGLLARFATDIDKLTLYGDNLRSGALSKAVIDAAIADYYFMQQGFSGKEFFTAITGGISFDLSDIGAIWSNNKTAIQLANTVTQQYNLDLQTRLFLKQNNGWAIQSGTDALKATGTGNNNDAMIGGATDDTLDGGDGNDFLLGGEGTDVLTGGAGNDLLLGGADGDTLTGDTGYDTYLVDGSDTIQDSDGKGILKDKTGQFITGVLEKRPDGSYHFLGNDSITVSRSADLILTLDDGSVITVKNWQDGQLGLQLIEAAKTDAGGPIAGDLVPTDIDPGKAGIQATLDANGNPLGEAGPYADILNGTAGNDHIQAGELADDVRGGEGDDWLEGESGNDVLSGGTGKDLLEGGTDRDILIGGSEDDRLFAGTQIDLADAIVAGNTDEATDTQGEWLAGNEGDDILVGSEGDDVLTGGAGSDLLIGGAGADYLLGDADYVAAIAYRHDEEPAYFNGANRVYHSDAETFNWTVAKESDTVVFAPVFGEIDPAGSAGDVIYAGSGNDQVWAGAGDDVVLGEGGDDTISGDEGADVLQGGDGKDKIWGDSTRISETLHSSDLIDGGDGDDTLYGMGGDDTLYGGKGNDELFGDQSDQATAGNNTLHGEDGNDTLWGGKGDDDLFGGADDDQLYAGEGANFLDGGDGIDTLNAGGAGSTLFGGAGNDELFAAAGNNYLDGGTGNDSLIAEGGNNTLFGGAGDDELSAAGGNSNLEDSEGNNKLVADGGGNTLIAGSGDDTLSSGGGSSYLEAGDGNNTLIADGGGNTLIAGSGDDRLDAAGGNNTLDGGSGNDRLATDGGHNTLYGGDGDDIVSSGGGNSFLFGGSGSDLLLASGGGNTFDGGADSDIYLFNAGSGENRIADSGGPAGGNAVQFNFAFAGSGVVLGIGSLKLSFANGDVLHIDGFDPQDPINSCSITEFKFLDRALSLPELLALGMDFVGTPGEDTLSGTALADRIEALESNDVVEGRAGNDELQGNDGDDRLSGGDGNDLLYGQEGNDTLFGDDGDDALYGGDGADLMAGGSGDDVYVVDDAGDTVIEEANGGQDSVLGLVDTTLSDHVENLRLQGGATVGTGNDADNELIADDLSSTLQGMAGNDILRAGEGDDLLDGGSGADRMLGGGGYDTYMVDDINDVIEDSDGIDTVISSIDYVLGSDLEDLVLTGNASLAGYGNDSDNRITGNEGDNLLVGGNGYDVLKGKGGNDWLVNGEGDGDLIGGEGDDTYVLSHFEGVDVSEDEGEGRDRIITTVDDEAYLPSNVEDLELADVPESTAELWTAYGNELDNQITGNSYANYLDGGDGADTLIGGNGNDIYRVDHSGDTVLEGEGPDSGIDQVNAAVDFTLSDNVENLQLDGYEAVVGTGNALGNDIIGNELDNVLSGLDGDDRIDGGAGDDQMLGGTGNDTYVVDAAGDVTLELAGEGDDHVYASLTHTLSDNVEALTLTGGSNIDGTGNALDNRLTGNERNNLLTGLDGNDLLDGGWGADRLIGGQGDDTYRVDSWYEEVVELTDEGHDTVIADESFALTDNVEDLILLGDFAGTQWIPGHSGQGNALDNKIVGNDGQNNLQGRDGNDVIDGRADDDNIYGEEGDDRLYGGDDAMFVGPPEEYEYAVAYAGEFGDGSGELASENGQHYLAPNDDSIDGGGGNDEIDGGSGNDRLYGGTGNDVIYGGADGLYVPGAAIVYQGDGYWLNYQDFLSNYDRLYGDEGDDTLDGGSGNDELFGGDGSDVLFGGADGLLNLSNDDLLDGGQGLDLLVGGTGNDVYIVDGEVTELPPPPPPEGCDIGSADDPLVRLTSSIADTVIEQADEGWDVVYTSVSMVTPDNVEEIHASEGWNIDLTGNAANNLLYGNSGNNILDGGLGADVMVGEWGDDTYLVDHEGDGVVEYDGGGIDTVRSSIDGYELGWNVENLDLTDHATTGYGNELDNRIRGNRADNVLYGSFGNDQIAGAGGNDQLYGGDGDDTYYFGRGGGFDVISDNSGADKVVLVNDLMAESMRLSRSGDDLLIRFSDGEEQLTLAGWMTGGNSVNTVAFCGGPAFTRDDLLAMMSNQAPVATADLASVQEDVQPIVVGNLLANDTDPDGDALSLVTAPGSTAGNYGVLTLGADGSYTYSLNNGSASVQSMAEGTTATEHFGYEVSDGQETTAGQLSITVFGSNDRPQLERALSDVSFKQGATASWAVPAGGFIDIDQGDVLHYSATLADGSALPDWLVFDPATQRFSGTVPANASGNVDITVTAYDGHGPDSFASDTFRLSFVAKPPKGNEGVGNGEDPPPPGHGCNWNDGPGTSPGHPGSQGGQGHGKGRDGDRCDTDRDDDDHGHSGKPSGKDHGYLNPAMVDRMCRDFSPEKTDPRSSSRCDNDVSRRWSEMDRALSASQRRDSGGEWLHARSSADVSALHGMGVGNSSAGRGRCDAFSLTAANTQLKGFDGLQEGVRRL